MRAAIALVLAFALTAGCIEGYLEFSEAVGSYVLHGDGGLSNLDIIPDVQLGPTTIPSNNPDSFVVGSWGVTHHSNVADEWDAELFLEEEGDVLRYHRSNSMNDGGMVTFDKGFLIDVRNYSEVVVEADVQLVTYNEEGSGWWCEGKTCTGEFPAKVTVGYTGLEGSPYDGVQTFWTWGFLHEENPYSKTNYDVVPQTGWYSFTSGNLMDENPRPTRLMMLSVGGNGWDFRGAFRNVRIVADGEVIR